MKVIVYTNKNGNISVCTPSGELSIEEVLIKDCPEGAIIVDDSTLPSDSFDAWELVNGKVMINQTKKQAIINAEQASSIAKEAALSKLTTLGLTTDEIKALLGVA